MGLSAQAATAILKNMRVQLDEALPDTDKLRYVWHSAGYLRSLIIAKDLRATIGDKVYSGPFKGMRLTPAAMTHAFAPYLLGTYEEELHPAIEQAVAETYTQVLNIGCSFGYYSVGLALRLPQAQIHSFDIDEHEQHRCRGMARLNQVQDRINIAGSFRGEDFAAYAGSKTLVIMDIEGTKKTLLDPALYPELKRMDIIVELHDLFDDSTSTLIARRFQTTHDIGIIMNRPRLFDFAPLLGALTYVDPYDSLLAVMENRDGPTPWVYDSKIPLI